MSAAMMLVTKTKGTSTICCPSNRERSAQHMLSKLQLGPLSSVRQMKMTVLMTPTRTAGTAIWTMRQKVHDEFTLYTQFGYAYAVLHVLYGMYYSYQYHVEQF